MGSAILFTAARTQEIEDGTVVSGLVDGNGHLILYHHDGSTVDAGNVKGDPTPLPSRLAIVNNLGSGNDPDTLTDTGWYSGFNWVGGLAGVYTGIATLEVIQYSPDWITQVLIIPGASPQSLIRSRYNGTTWSTWLPVSMQGHTHSLSDVTITNIPNAANLDNYKTQGLFGQTSDAQAAAGTNYPVPYAGHLEVLGNGSASFAFQRYTTYRGALGGSRLFTRSYYAPTWSEWEDTALGYSLLQVIKFTSSGTFNKAAYPGLKAIRVRLVGGGGAGGGAAATSGGNNSVGAGGGGGGYAESFITSIPTSIAVTIGGGGSGGTGVGAAGGASSFGTLVAANGGGGGDVKPNSINAPYVSGGGGGDGTAGDLLITGQGGATGAGYASLAAGGAGGSSQLGGGARSVGTGAGASGVTGWPGGNYGGGGSGATTTSGGPSHIGGDGAPGIVIVEVYA